MRVARERREDDFILIGETFPKIKEKNISVLGRYEERELQLLIKRERIDLLFFPALWPETYSYTLSSALEAKLPIVAPLLGAFSERLEGREGTWLVEPSVDPKVWNRALDQAKREIVRAFLLEEKTHP